MDMSDKAADGRSSNGAPIVPRLRLAIVASRDLPIRGKWRLAAALSGEAAVRILEAATEG